MFPHCLHTDLVGDLDNLGWGNRCQFHNPEESLFLANEMIRQMSSVKWELASPQRLGVWARKGSPGDRGALEAHGQDGG